jgi:hypothetical protein
MVYFVGDTSATTSAIEPFTIGPSSIAGSYTVTYSTVLSSTSIAKSFVAVTGGNTISVLTSATEADFGTYVMKLVGELKNSDGTSTGVTVSSDYTVHVVKILGSKTDEIYRMDSGPKLYPITPFTQSPTTASDPQIPTLTYTYTVTMSDGSPAPAWITVVTNADGSKSI